MQTDENFICTHEKLILNVGRELVSLQLFFKANGIDEKIGAELLENFLFFTFNDRNISVNDSGGITPSIDQKPLGLRQWADDVKPLLVVMQDQNKNIIEDFYCNEDNCVLEGEALRSAFADILFGADQSYNPETKDGTASVFACLVASNLLDNKCSVLIH